MSYKVEITVAHYPTDVPEATAIEHFNTIFSDDPSFGDENARIARALLMYAAKVEAREPAPHDP